MSIVIITGPSQTGKTLIATALRNNQISNKYGALLIDETQDGELVHQIEKIIVGEPLMPGTPADSIPWKPNAMIILVGGKEALFDEIEKMAPGIMKLLGPIYRIATSKE